MERRLGIARFVTMVKPRRTAVQWGATASAWIVAIAACVGSPALSPDVTPTSSAVVGASSTTSTSTTEASRSTSLTGGSLPIAIASAVNRGDVPAEVSYSPDWVELDAGPLSQRAPAVVAWTGEEIVLWGGEDALGELHSDGAAYNPKTDEWRILSSAPIPAIREPGSVWTGTELIIWGGDEAAAWNPKDDSWRTIESWPISNSFFTHAVWTGTHILDAELSQLVDPISGHPEPIARRPQFEGDWSVVWTGDGLVVIGASYVYAASLDVWQRAPGGNLGRTSDGALTGIGVVVVNYKMRAVRFDIEDRIWSPMPSLPLRFSECRPDVTSVDSVPLAALCTGLGIWDPDITGWLPIGFPDPHDLQARVYIAADDSLYTWGRGFHRLRQSAITDPQRISVGTSLLELPAAWRVVSTKGEPGTFLDANTIELESDSGQVCAITGSHHDDLEKALNGYMQQDHQIVLLTPDIGGKALEAITIRAGTVDDRHHLIWATGTTDMIDVACSAETSTKAIAASVWEPGD